MISFKQYLTLKEDVEDDIKELKENPQLKAIKDWLKTDSARSLMGTAPSDVNDNNGKKYLSEINDIINKFREKILDGQEEDEVDPDELDDRAKKLGFKSFEDIKEIEDIDELKEISNSYNKKTESIRRTHSDIENASGNGLKKEFFKNIEDNKNFILQNIDGNDITNIMKILKRNDNGDDKIDKQEFIKAIISIKKAFPGNTKEAVKKPASILWLMYLRANGLKASDRESDDNERIFKNDYTINQTSFKNGINDSSLVDKTDKKNPQITDSGKNIIHIFDNFGKCMIDFKVLKNFNTLPNAQRFLARDIEDIKKNLGDEGFTAKSPEQREKEQIDAETRETNADINSAQQRANELNDELDKIKNDKNNPLDDDVIQKRKFYIFDVERLKAESLNSGDDVDDFFDNIKNNCNELLDKISKRLEELAPKLKHNKDDLKLEENISKRIMAENGFIITEDYENSYNKKSGKVNKFKENAQKELEKLFDSEKGSLRNLAEKIIAENDYKKMINLRLKFNNAITQLGYKATKIIETATTKANNILKYMGLDKEIDDAKKYKTLDQKGQEGLDITKIKQIITGSFQKDHQNLAKILLINLLTKFNDSKEIVDRLNAKSFNGFFEEGLIYAGTTGSIYALDKNDVSKKHLANNNKDLGYDAYVFVKDRARIYKKPRELLNSIGINIDSLTVDVMKEVKKSLMKEAENAKKYANDYIEAAKKMKQLISGVSGNSSVVTEGLGDLLGKARDKISDVAGNIKDKAKNFIDKQKEDFNSTNIKQDEDTQNFVNNTQGQQFTDNNPDTGTITITSKLNNIAKKINWDDRFEPQGEGVEDIVLRQFFKGFVLIKSNDNKNIFVTTKEKYEMDLEKNINQVLPDAVSNLNPDPAASSVVTSNAADNTYGNGYSKRTNAIKKKLNTTTYTYSPNSKLKIVRRTFD